MSEEHPNSSGPWWSRLGPALITACVVIGPGSILTSSKIGANQKYDMLWVVVVAVTFMLVFMQLGAKLGVVAKESPGEIIRQRAGRWLSAAVGTGVFFIAAAFQSGNNIGIGAAMEEFVASKNVVIGLIVLFNLLAIGFLFAFRDFYKILERLMMFLVAVMLLCFAANLFQLRPSPAEMVQGLVPSFGESADSVTILGLIGTTFAIAGAFYQAYLVRQKGWTISDLRTGIVDVRVGALVMAVITVMLMATSASGLFTGQKIELANPIAVADALEPTFGATGRLIFCLGLFSAAYSSFLVNCMIGGFMASDGFGFGSNPADTGPRLLTALAMLCGMAVGVAAIGFDFDRTPTIIAAQAVTVIFAPLIGGVLLWLTSSREVMGEHTNSLPMKLFAGLGLCLLIVMAGKTAFIDLPPRVQSYFFGGG